MIPVCAEAGKNLRNAVHLNDIKRLFSLTAGVAYTELLENRHKISRA
jgi:hypothetical protein